MTDAQLTDDELAADLDTQFRAAALAIGMAAALQEGPDATQAMVDLTILWPDTVPTAAGIIGYRVAMILAEAFDRGPTDLGALSAHLLDNTTEGDRTDD